MADNAQDQKDYQDYLDYQKYQASQQGPQNPIDAYAEKYNAKFGKPDIGGSLENLAGAQLLAPAKSILGRVGQNMGMAGARAAGHAQGGVADKAEAGGLAAFLSGGLSAAGEGLAAGGSKLADYLMQKAAGMRKLTPGVGNRLVDQGLVGTRNMLTNQVEDKLPGAEEAVQGAVKSLTQPTSSDEMAQAIATKGRKFVSPSGITLNSVAPDLEKVTEAAGQFNPAYAGREGPVGQLTPEDLLSLKRQGDWAGYTASGNPAAATDSEIGRAIADKSRSLLSDMSEGDTAEALANEQALVLARNALKKPETIHQGMGSTAFFGKYPGQSLIGSTAAQALQKGISPAAKGVVDPRLLPSLFGK